MKTTSQSFRKFVSYLNNQDEEGGYWLPKIQRTFVWDEKQIEKLYDSILREYPIGTLLVWKTKNKIKRRKFIDNYRPDIKISQLYIPEDDRIKMLVLDGQQRLQSLFIGLKGSYEGRELAINVLSGEVAAPDDIKYKFKFMEPAEITAPWFRIKDIVFSKKEYNLIADDILKRFPTQLSNEESQKVNTIVAKIVRIFCGEDNLPYQTIDSIDATDLYKEDDVVEIFIRANSGGTQLGKSDLLFSLLTLDWDDSDEEMEDLLESLNRTGFNFSRDFILKTCLSIIGKGAAYNVEKFRDANVKKTIVQDWKNISEAIQDVKDYVYGMTFIKTDKTLPSYLALIPLIYFRYKHKEKWTSTKDIQKYLIRTLLSGAFSGSPDTLIDRCTKKIDELKEFDVTEIFAVIREAGRSLEISKELIFNQSYGSKEIHLLFNYWYNFNYVPSYFNNKPQVDHIFPQSVLKKIKKRNPENGKMNLMKYKQQDRDQIANCMLLTARENGAGGKTDITPEEWFADKSPDYLEMHLIPNDPQTWKIENFENFIKERKKLIEKKFEEIIIKEVSPILSPVDFELFTKRYFERTLKEHLGIPIVVSHRKKFATPTGREYQIDLSYEFQVGEAKYQTIIECKQWNSLVTRGKLNEFKAVMDELKVQKGVFVTSKGYQSGAIEFARENGIALLKLTEKALETYSHADGGINELLETLQQESNEASLAHHTEKELIGMSFPSDKSLWEYILKKYGKNFALFLLEAHTGKFDLDMGEVPAEFESILKTMDLSWVNDYIMLETAGLNTKLENEPEIRTINLLVFLLKTRVENSDILND